MLRDYLRACILLSLLETMDAAPNLNGNQDGCGRRLCVPCALRRGVSCLFGVDHFLHDNLLGTPMVSHREPPGK